MKKYIAVAMMVFSMLAANIPMTALAAEKKAEEKKEGKKSKKSTKKKSSGKADYSPLNFLPFGVGQFRQGHTVEGAVLGGGQALMLYLYMDRKAQVSQSNKDATATINEVNASGEPASDETLSYLSRNADYVKKTNQEASLCLVGFLGLWGLSVVDAVWDPLHHHKAVAKAKTAADELEDDSAAKWAAEKKVEQLESSSKLSLMVLPSSAERRDNTFGLTWAKSFR